MSHPMLLSPIARHSELLIPSQALHRHNRKWQKTVNGARGYAASEIASCQQEPKAGTQVNVQKKAGMSCDTPARVNNRSLAKS